MAKRSRNALSYFVLALAIAVEIYTLVRLAPHWLNSL